MEKAQAQIGGFGCNDDDLNGKSFSEIGVVGSFFDISVVDMLSKNIFPTNRLRLLYPCAMMVKIALGKISQRE